MDGMFLALRITCTNNHVFLSLGEGSTIVCPLHKSAFSLASGIYSLYKVFLFKLFNYFNLPGEVVGDWCPFPPILGPLILGNLAPPEKVSTFPVRSKGASVEVFIDRLAVLNISSCCLYLKYYSIIET